MSKIRFSAVVRIRDAHRLATLSEFVRAVGPQNIDPEITCNSPEDAQKAYRNAEKESWGYHDQERNEYLWVFKTVIEESLWIPLSMKAVNDASSLAEIEEVYLHLHDSANEKGFLRWLELCNTSKEVKRMFRFCWEARYSYAPGKRKKEGPFLNALEKWNLLTLEEARKARCLEEARSAWNDSSRHCIAQSDPEEVKSGTAEALVRWDEFALIAVREANTLQEIVNLYHTAPKEGKAREEALRRLVKCHESINA